MKGHEVKTKKILIPSKLPGIDYAINPYVGCSYGCLYCYASFMGSFVQQPVSQWGKYVYAKINAVELLVQEITQLKKGQPKSILFSSVTDSYQPLEQYYQLTRRLLQVLVQQSYTGKISILTKSPLVLRDVDVLAQLPQKEVGLTITATDDRVSSIFESFAPTMSRRLETLQQLSQQGFQTYAFIGPLLPHFYLYPQRLSTLFERIANTGVSSVFVEHINLSTYICNRLFKHREVSKEEKYAYQQAQNKACRDEVQKIVNTLVKKYRLVLRFSKVFEH